MKSKCKRNIPRALTSANREAWNSVTKREAVNSRPTTVKNPDRTCDPEHCLNLIFRGFISYTFPRPLENRKRIHNFIK